MNRLGMSEKSKKKQQQKKNKKILAVLKARVKVKLKNIILLWLLATVHLDPTHPYLHGDSSCYDSHSKSIVTPANFLGNVVSLLLIFIPN